MVKEKFENIICKGRKDKKKCKSSISKLTSGERDGIINAKNGLFAFHDGKGIRITKEYTKNEALITLAEIYAEKGG